MKLSEIYWIIREYKIFHPVKLFREMKWFYQRGKRGWADKDTWSLDSYLANWLPDALSYLKTHTHGIPVSAFEGLPVNEEGYYNDSEHKTAEERWNVILDKMILGFQAYIRMQDGVYEAELGPYPVGEYYNKLEVITSRLEASSKLEARDKLLFEEAKTLLIKHWQDLWD
jgi:hypothetical protein